MKFEIRPQSLHLDRPFARSTQSSDHVRSPVQHGIRIQGSRFWVVHRSRAYGPFDYEWSPDFLGLEFQYQGRKFGEYCSDSELHADLKEFRLPRRVYEVASISIGTMIRSIFEGVAENDRGQCLVEQLVRMGYPQYAEIQ